MAATAAEEEALEIKAAAEGREAAIAAYTTALHDSERKVCAHNLCARIRARPRVHLCARLRACLHTCLCTRQVHALTVQLQAANERVEILTEDANVAQVPHVYTHVRALV